LNGTAEAGSVISIYDGNTLLGVTSANAGGAWSFTPTTGLNDGMLVALGLLINLPAVILQWRLDWAYRWCAFLLQAPRELSAPLQT
ncbi:hypothetical protein ONJ87_26970, partial [Salmonella enterica subsp. enterica serovar Anatum]|nr:hypothetical protein [Salmonella enterica subsp. enterica serovar Anatum]